MARARASAAARQPPPTRGSPLALWHLFTAGWGRGAKRRRDGPGAANNARCPWLPRAQGPGPRLARPWWAAAAILVFRTPHLPGATFGLLSKPHAHPCRRAALPPPSLSLRSRRRPPCCRRRSSSPNLRAFAWEVTAPGLASPWPADCLAGRGSTPLRSWRRTRRSARPAPRACARARALLRGNLAT